MLLLTCLLVVTWLMLGAIVWALLHLIGQNGRLLQRLEALESARGAVPAKTEPDPTGAMQPAPSTVSERRGLERGTSAPAFQLPDLDGAFRTLSDLAGRKVLLVFFHPRCGYCLQMLPGLAALPWEPEGAGPVPLLISSGTRAETCQALKGHKIRFPVLLQEGMTVAGQYAVDGTPMGYLLDEKGRIASELAVGGAALLALLPANPSTDPEPAAAPSRGNRPLSESRLERDGLRPGTPAPDFRLPTVDGEEIALHDCRGRSVLLVFSDPNCGPCDALAPGLEAFHRRRADVTVLMISRGTVEENAPKVRAHGLTFPVALQRRWEISLQYAKFGTPIAYHIDPGGTIAAEVAVGAEGVLDLAERIPAAMPEPVRDFERKEVVALR